MHSNVQVIAATVGQECGRWNSVMFRSSRSVLADEVNRVGIGAASVAKADMEMPVELVWTTP